jgi:hypothetical protein
LRACAVNGASRRRWFFGRVEGASGGAELFGDDDAVPVEIDARPAQRVKLARGQRRPKHSAAAATLTKN